MLFLVLLLASANASTINSKLAVSTTICQNELIACATDTTVFPTAANETDPLCMVIDTVVADELTDMGVLPADTTIDISVVPAFLVATTAHIVSHLVAAQPNYYLYFSLLQCVCANTAECDWEESSAVATTSQNCIDDSKCVDAMNEIYDLTKDHAKWDDFKSNGFPINFPVASQEVNGFCAINMATMKAANAKAFSLGTTMMATAVENADDVLVDCGKKMGMGIFLMIAGISIGCIVMTLCGAFAYCKWCQNKDD